MAFQNINILKQRKKQLFIVINSKEKGENKMPKKQFKWDTDRIAIAFLTIVFAILVRLMTHNVLRFGDFNASVFVSPIIALIAAQYIIERHIDFREAFIFVIALILSINLINFIPSVSQFDLFALQMNNRIGVVFSMGIYLVAIPLSVIVSDWVTDRMKRK